MHRSLVDRLVGLSAEIAFYEFLAIFPFLIFCVNGIALLPSEGLLMMYLPAVAPAPAVTLVQSWFDSIQESSGLALLSLSALGTVWAASAGVGSFIEAFAVINRATTRAGLVRRTVTRVAFTVIGAILFFGALFLWGAAPWLASYLFEETGFWDVWEGIWTILRLPMAATLVVGAMMIFYHFLGLSGRPFRSHWPGAVLCAIVFWGATSIFSLYVRYVANFNATYGSLGAIVLLLMWLQTFNFSILVGEFWNAQLRAEKEKKAEQSGAAINSRDKPDLFERLF